MTNKDGHDKAVFRISPGEILDGIEAFHKSEFREETTPKYHTPGSASHMPAIALIRQGRLSLAGQALDNLYNKGKTKIMNSLTTKYKEGEYVYARTNLAQRLVVRRYLARVYYCRIQGDPARKDLVYFEKDLISAAEANAGTQRKPGKGTQ